MGKDVHYAPDLFPCKQHRQDIRQEVPQLQVTQLSHQIDSISILWNKILTANRYRSFFYLYPSCWYRQFYANGSNPIRHYSSTPSTTSHSRADVALSYANFSNWTATTALWHTCRNTHSRLEYTRTLRSCPNNRFYSVGWLHFIFSSACHQDRFTLAIAKPDDDGIYGGGECVRIRSAQKMLAKIHIVLVRVLMGLQ